MYIQKHTYKEIGEPYSITEEELITEEGEIEQLFIEKWAEEGYAYYVTAIDDLSGEEIVLEDSDYFNQAEIEALREYVDHESEPDAEQIKAFLKMLRGV